VRTILCDFQPTLTPIDFLPLGLRLPLGTSHRSQTCKDVNSIVIRGSTNQRFDWKNQYATSRDRVFAPGKICCPRPKEGAIELQWLMLGTECPVLDHSSQSSQTINKANSTTAWSSPHRRKIAVRPIMKTGGARLERHRQTAKFASMVRDVEVWLRPYIMASPLQDERSTEKHQEIQLEFD
jgi:hypothetical protein